MKRKPAWQQHDLDGNVGYAAPRQLPEERKCNASKYISSGRAAALQDRSPRPLHVCGLRIVARELQSEVCFDGATQVEIAVVIERPTAMLCLMSAQVGGDFYLQRRIDFLQKVHHQDVFGGNR